MRILVISKMSIPAAQRTIPDWDALRQMGHHVWVCHPNQLETKPDAIIAMGVTVMDETFAAITRWPSVPLYCYNWDCYEWVWSRPRKKEYNYRKYGTLLSQATEIWVPSECTKKRTVQWWDNMLFGINIEVILSCCPYWDHDNAGYTGHALCCLREIPDLHWGMFEKACEDLGIVYKMTRHEQTYEEYQGAVAGCRFICAPLYELSTGGLSLMEAYYLGKPVLISDSEWNGARDYFGDRAVYFQSGDIDDLKSKLEFMITSGHLSVPNDHREYITENFSDLRMVNDMLRRIEETSK